MITDLCSAVKELVENSLDAGATSVEVRLKNCGETLIEVVDNGKGVHPDDHEMLAVKHTTSKLEDFDGLQTLKSFGFRGEALSSLCAVSKLEVTSRHGSEAVGTVLSMDRMGSIASRKSVARGVGTTVSVHELFRGMPVRHQELQRHLKREYGKLLGLLNGYGLICTGVRLSVSNTQKSKQVAFTTKGSKSIRDNVIEILGVKQMQHMLLAREVDLVKNMVREGLLSPKHAEGFIEEIIKDSQRIEDQHRELDRAQAARAQEMIQTIANQSVGSTDENRESLNFAIRPSMTSFNPTGRENSFEGDLPSRGSRVQKFV